MDCVCLVLLRLMMLVVSCTSSTVVEWLLWRRRRDLSSVRALLQIVEWKAGCTKSDTDGGCCLCLVYHIHTHIFTHQIVWVYLARDDMRCAIRLVGDRSMKHKFCALDVCVCCGKTVHLYLYIIYISLSLFILKIIFTHTLARERAETQLCLKITTHPDVQCLRFVLLFRHLLLKKNRKRLNTHSYDIYFWSINDNVPSPCISDVQSVRLSLSNCIINVESL